VAKETTFIKLCVEIYADATSWLWPARDLQANFFNALEHLNYPTPFRYFSCRAVASAFWKQGQFTSSTAWANDGSGVQKTFDQSNQFSPMYC
jgi:hypothetical protein